MCVSPATAVVAFVVLAVGASVARAAPVDVPDTPVPTAASLQVLLDAAWSAGETAHLRFPSMDVELEDTLRLPPDTRLEPIDTGGHVTFRWAAAALPAAKPLMALSMPDAHYAPIPGMPFAWEPDAEHPTAPPDDLLNPTMDEHHVTSLRLSDLTLDHSGAVGGHAALQFGARGYERAYQLAYTEYQWNNTAEPPVELPPVVHLYNGTHTVHEGFALDGAVFERVHFLLGAGNPGATAVDVRPCAYKFVTDPVTPAQLPVGDIHQSEYALRDTQFRQCTFELGGSEQVALALGAPTYRVTVTDCDFNMMAGGVAGLVVREISEFLVLENSFFRMGAERGGAVVLRATRSAMARNLQIAGTPVLGAYHMLVGSGARGVTVQGLAGDGGWNGLVVTEGAKEVSASDLAISDMVAYALLVEGSGTEQVTVSGSTLASASADTTVAAALVRDGAVRVRIQGASTLTRDGHGPGLEVRGPGTRDVALLDSEVVATTHAVLLRQAATVRNCDLGGSQSGVFVASEVEDEPAVTYLQQNTIYCEGIGGHVFHFEAQVARAMLSGNQLSDSCSGRESLYTPGVVQAFLETGTVAVPNATAAYTGGDFFHKQEDRTFYRNPATEAGP